MSKIFKNIKGLFIEEVDEQPKAKETVKKPATNTNKGKTQNPAPKTTIQRPTNPNPSSNTTKGQATQKFLDIFFKAMEDNNLEGLDYLEFKQSLQSLSKMPMDEETQFKSAFAMASSMGVTPDKLINTAKHYIDVLTKEEQKFEAALEQQIDGKIGQQKQELAAMEKSILEKSEQIKKLTQQITEIQQKAEKTRTAMNQASEKINVTKSNFIASYNQVRGQIESDIDKMKHYLGAKETPKPPKQ